DPFAFFDIDDCATADGQWMPHAHNIMQLLPGAWETSQSGKGLHGIGRVTDKAALACLAKNWKAADGHKMECYLTGRFMAIGGGGFIGAPTNWQELLPIVVPMRAAAQG